MRHLIDILDFSSDEIDSLIKTVDDIIKNPDSYAQRCSRKKGWSTVLRRVPAA